MELSGCNIKKFLRFSQKKKKKKNAFLIFWETETLKKFFIFREATFQACKIKKAHFEKGVYILGNQAFFPPKNLILLIKLP